MRCTVDVVSRRGADAGFSLVEVLVAQMVILLVLTTGVAFYVRTLTTVTLARQRQQAAQLATQGMEQLRALPYATLTAGLASGDLIGDANLVAIGGRRSLVLPAAGISEPVVASGNGQTPPPLNPHVVAVPLAGGPYTVSTYITQVDGALTFTLTVVVQWAAPGGGAPRTILQRSQAFSPTGCLSTATHPFAGPCQSILGAEAGVTPLSLSVSDVDDPDTPVQGFDGTGMELTLPGLSTALAVEQSVAATARVRTSGGEAPGVPEGTSGDLTALASASTDPGRSLPPSDAATTPAQTSAPARLSGAAGTLTATPGTADSGSVAAAAAAPPGWSCPDPAGGTLPAGQPCASGSVRQQGLDAVMSADLSGTATSRTLPAFELARIGPPAAPSSAVAARVTRGTPSACPLTTGDGCVVASAARSLGAISLGGLPIPSSGDTTPAGFAAAVTVTGVSDSARAEAGTGERPPVAVRTAGTLAYWDGTRMTSVSLTGAAVPASVDPPAVTATYRGTAGDIVITVDPLVTVGGPAAISTGTTPCTPSQCRREASPSDVTVSLLYSVTVGGRSLTRFVVTADLGAPTAKASFRGAPSA